MFEASVYTHRRNALRSLLKNGIIFLPGNTEAPMNYPANTYHFRQDSNFLYFFGLTQPDLAGIIDLDNGTDILFGNNFGIEDIIWMGPQPTMEERAALVGVESTHPMDELKNYIAETLAKGRQVHFIPPYRAETQLWLSSLLGIRPSFLKNYASPQLIRAIVSLREIKDEIEIIEIERMVDVAHMMHTTAMQMAHPGITEQEIFGRMEGIALSKAHGTSFPIILSVNGQTLHNHSHGNVLTQGRLMVSDAGCESADGYCSDITRTIPVGGKFSQKQKDIYQIVLAANETAIEESQPGVFYRDVHLKAALMISAGLRDLGLMKGNVEDAVAAGAHALFFPHGLGHQMGLDVHDMEGLGENFVGYDEEVHRSSQFGLAYLRMAKRLKPGHVITVEPGIYFIPALIQQWKEQNLHAEFIDYAQVEKYLDFGGIRIEDDILITPDGCRILGKPIPKSVADVETEVSRGL